MSTFLKPISEVEYLARVAAHGRSALRRELAASVVLNEVRALHEELARLRGGIARAIGRVDEALEVMEIAPAGAQSLAVVKADTHNV